MNMGGTDLLICGLMESNTWRNGTPNADKRKAMAEEKSGGEKVSATQAIFGIVLGIGAIWYFYGGGMQNEANKNLQDIENKVASDSITQYQIAKRNGTKIDACVQAGMVAAAFLQAKDEGQYKSWKQTEKSDCAAAGMPDQ